MFHEPVETWPVAPLHRRGETADAIPSHAVPTGVPHGTLDRGVKHSTTDQGNPSEVGTVTFETYTMVSRSDEVVFLRMDEHRVDCQLHRRVHRSALSPRVAEDLRSGTASDSDLAIRRHLICHRDLL